MSIYAERFKERLEWAKEHRGLTQAEIAKYAGMGRTSVSNIRERGGTPNERSLLKLAEILECDLNWLFGRDVTPEWPKEDPLVSIKDRLDSIDKKIAD